MAAGVLGGAWSARAEAAEVGQKAPGFNLPATTGGKISLTQLHGKPVLIEFYGADFSPV
jgi:peroxiredoxin